MPSKLIPQWQGEMRYINGKKIILNPKYPIFMDSPIQFKKDLIIGSNTTKEEGLLGFIACFDVDAEGNVYIVDIKSGSIKVFNSNGEFLRSIGRKGQGPGEFQVPTSIQWTSKNELMILDSGKNALLFISSDGELIDERKDPSISLSAAAYGDSRGDYYVLKMASFENPSLNLVKMNPSFKVLGTYALPDKIARMPQKSPMNMISYTIDHDDQLIWGINSKYELHIVDSLGSEQKIIQKEESVIQVTKEYKESILKAVPQSYRSKVAFQELFPSYDLIGADDEGFLYVKTFETDKISKKSSIDIFDKDGRYFSRALLRFPLEARTPYDRFVIEGKSIYVKDYDENDLPVIVRYKIMKYSIQ